MPKAQAKPKTQYVCDACGASFPKWGGQCGQCGAWNTLVESVVMPALEQKRRNSAFYGLAAEDYVSALEVMARKEESAGRLPTGLYELDRVFGGGIVKGSVFLVGGQPGIGKSTILTQMILKMLQDQPNHNILYVAGEESPTQIAHRIERMMAVTANAKSDYLGRLSFSAVTDIDQLLGLLAQKKPSLVVVDSIQSMFTGDLTGIVGSVAQLRETTLRLVSFAKQSGTPIFLVGHVTKDGDIAGPKILEHIVDAVVEITGDRSGEIRLVRSLKNRFGPTDEVGLFRLTGDGAQEVSNPAEIFLEEQSLGKPGSALAVCLEGTRPVVVEVQALVVNSYLPSPRRVSRGINVNKLHLLLAVLQKHAKLDLSSHDVFVNVVGNLEFKDPGIDLAVAAALISSKKEKSLGGEAVYCGEIGLLGEVRRVAGLEKRIKEAQRLGYTIVRSAKDLKHVSGLSRQEK
jgi:DNA repair protein RadA/Sms